MSNRSFAHLGGDSRTRNSLPSRAKRSNRRVLFGDSSEEEESQSQSTSSPPSTLQASLTSFFHSSHPAQTYSHAKSSASSISTPPTSIDSQESQSQETKQCAKEITNFRQSVASPSSPSPAPNSMRKSHRQRRPPACSCCDTEQEHQAHNQRSKQSKKPYSQPASSSKKASPRSSKASSSKSQSKSPTSSLKQICLPFVATSNTSSASLKRASSRTSPSRPFLAPPSTDLAHDHDAILSDATRALTFASLDSQEVVEQLLVSDTPPTPDSLGDGAGIRDAPSILEEREEGEGGLVDHDEGLILDDDIGDAYGVLDMADLMFMDDASREDVRDVPMLSSRTDDNRLVVSFTPGQFSSYVPPPADRRELSPIPFQDEDADLIDDTFVGAPIGFNQPHPPPPSDCGSDDGDELAALMRRAEALADAQHTGPVDTIEESIENDMMILDDSDFILDPVPHNDKREQALQYLESIPTLLFTELHTSIVQINAHKATLLPDSGAANKSRKGNKETKGKGKRKSFMAVLSEDEEDEEEEEEETLAVGKNRIDCSNVGLEIKLKNRKTGGDQIISFPGDSQASEAKGMNTQRRLACIMRVCELLYEAILTNVVTTKRDIYYKDVALFRHQRVVDALVDDIAATAGLKRQDFHVCATSKGLVASTHLVLRLRCGEAIVVSPLNASLIPPIERIDSISAEDFGGVDWVLVVEKDAVFQTLCSAGLLARDDLGSGVLVTGKGYPDLATIQLLHLISITYPDARIHALVDADPHGLDILSVYTYGSQASRHSMDHDGLALGDRIEWMGVRASEWLSLGVRFEDLLNLSDKDVQKAQAMLRDRKDMPSTWKRELVQMLHLNKKAEIQILASARKSDSNGAGIRDSSTLTMGDHNEQEKEIGGLLGYVVKRLKMPREPREGHYDPWDIMIMDDEW